MTTAVQMNANIITRAIRVESKSSGAEQLHLRCVDVALKIDPFAAIVELISAGVNPSDVKAVLGAMPRAGWRRTPGRGYGGTVRQARAQLLGAAGWWSLGGGGDSAERECG